MLVVHFGCAVGVVLTVLLADSVSVFALESVVSFDDEISSSVVVLGSVILLYR